MECDASVNRSITEFILDQSYLVQTAIMLGFVLVVFFATTVFWISSLVGGDFSIKFSSKVQEWTGTLSFLSIISILCMVAIEMDYWTKYQISKCNLSGMISVTKSLSFIVIFTLQILWIKEFILGYKYHLSRDPLRRHPEYSDTASDGATEYAFWNCSAYYPIFKNSFPRFFSVQGAYRHSFRRYGVMMFLGAIFSIMTASINWLKFMMINLGIIDLELELELLGFEIEYTLILEQLTKLHTKWLGFPFVNFVVDSLISIAAISWFIWRFKLYPKIPWVIRKFILKKL